jgi:hypothetical protein
VFSITYTIVGSDRQKVVRVQLFNSWLLRTLFDTHEIHRQDQSWQSYQPILSTGLRLLANPIQRPPMTQQSNPMTPGWIGLVGGHPVAKDGRADGEIGNFELRVRQRQMANL